MRQSGFPRHSVPVPGQRSAAASGGKLLRKGPLIWGQIWLLRLRCDEVITCAARLCSTWNIGASDRKRSTWNVFEPPRPGIQIKLALIKLICRASELPSSRLLPRLTPPPKRMEPAQANLRTHIATQRFGAVPSSAGNRTRFANRWKGRAIMNDANAFIGKTTQPTSAEITSALGPAAPVWEELPLRLRDEQKITIGEWTSSSPKHGWALRMKQKKRNILYMAPR